jgi:ABC-type arginine transport system ATPase subunit
VAKKYKLWKELQVAQGEVELPCKLPMFGKTNTMSKIRRFYKWALHYFFNVLLFGNVS